DVTGPYRGREAIDHVVGDLDRLLDGLESDGRQHRPENLLARDGHGRLHPLEHRRLDEVAAAVLAHPAAADADAGAVAPAGVDVAQHRFICVSSTIAPSCVAGSSGSPGWRLRLSA